MSTTAVIAVALFMAGMGLLALVAPTRFLRFVGSEPLGRDGRNEVRAVYGGFGVMMFAVLLYALRDAAYRPGILLCVGVALVGMALGRIISIIPDRGISPLMIAVLSGELAAGSMLLLAI